MLAHQLNRQGESLARNTARQRDGRNARKICRDGKLHLNIVEQLLQIVGIAIVMSFPELALWLPRLVYGN